MSAIPSGRSRRRSVSIITGESDERRLGPRARELSYLRNNTHTSASAKPI
jgi:hypothetical protein